MTEKTEKFIEKAIKKHNNKYHYDKVEYVNNKTKVCITCPIHGDFWQEPRHHISGQGCKLCGYSSMKEKTKTTLDDFIKKAKKTHNKDYDYSKVIYKGSETPVCISCPEHGEFWMTPHQFLKGSNCPKCSPRYKIDKQEFVKRATKKFGNKFDYSKTIINNFDEIVTITCPIHGDFEIKAKQHLNTKHGCQKCSFDATWNERGRTTTEEFIEKANKIHDNIYDYSKVKYVNALNEVTIICKEHGPFSQMPYKHLCGQGCPKCGMRYNKTELKILKTLVNEFKIVEYQKHLSELINDDNKLILDFYLPDYNTAIEYHGKQHFEPVSIFGGEEGYKLTRERDELKYKLCKTNNINIIYLTFEKLVINNYLDKIYNNLNEIIHLIKNK